MIRGRPVRPLRRPRGVVATMRAVPSPRPSRPRPLRRSRVAQPPAKFFVNQGVVTSRTDMLNLLRPLLKQTVTYRYQRGREVVAHGTGWVERIVVDQPDISTYFTPLAICLNVDSFEHLEFETRPDQLLVYTLVQGDERVVVEFAPVGPGERPSRRSRRASSRSTPRASSRWSSRPRRPARGRVAVRSAPVTRAPARKRRDRDGATVAPVERGCGPRPTGRGAPVGRRDRSE